VKTNGTANPTNNPAPSHVAGQPVGFQAGLYAGVMQAVFRRASTYGTDEVPGCLRLMTATNTRPSYEVARAADWLRAHGWLGQDREVGITIPESHRELDNTSPGLGR
jgi:hypothetical protein